MIPTDLDTRLKRREAASALTTAGYPISPATLATVASRGGGPVYRCFGRTVIYRWGDLLQRAEKRMTEPRRSTSESDINRVGFTGSRCRLDGKPV